MQSDQLIEYLGYIGFIFVALSLSMKNIKTLRILNLIGALIFVVYCFIKQNAWPVFALNAYLSIANIYHLIKLYSKPKT